MPSLRSLIGCALMTASLCGEVAANDGLPRPPGARPAIALPGASLVGLFPTAQWFFVASPFRFNGFLTFDVPQNPLKPAPTGPVPDVGGQDQNSFVPAVLTLLQEGRSSDFTTGDLNGDGLPELAVTNGPTLDEVTVLRNHGGGKFGKRWTYATGSSPVSPLIADLDGDGDGDLVVANVGTGDISIRLGDGTGSLGPQLRQAAGVNPRNLIGADFNLDGVIDLALLTGQSPSHIAILLGLGDGSFAPPRSSPSTFHALELVSADFDADGVPDLAVISVTVDLVEVRLGLGDGRFAPEQQIAVGNTPRGLTVGDFDGDGIQDLVIAAIFHPPGGGPWHGLGVLKGFGDGTFARPVLSAPFDNFGEALTAADIDGDGHLDLVAKASSLNLLAGKGNLSFGPPELLHVGAFPNWIDATDLDADGRPDLVSLNGFRNRVAVLINDG